MLARDDAQERSARLLLLGIGAVFAHQFGRPLAIRCRPLRQSGQRQPNGTLA